MSGWFNKPGSRSGSPGPGPAGENGSAKESAAAFQHGLQEHLEARAELLRLEAREAGEIVARKGILGLLIAILLFFAYALLLVGAVALLGSGLERALPGVLGGIGWQIAAVATGLLHLAIALALFNKLKRKLDTSLFEFTRAEFQKDREWLHQRQIRSKSENDSSR